MQNVISRSFIIMGQIFPFNSKVVVDYGIKEKSMKYVNSTYSEDFVKTNGYQFVIIIQIEAPHYSILYFNLKIVDLRIVKYIFYYKCTKCNDPLSCHQLSVEISSCICCACMLVNMINQSIASFLLDLKSNAAKILQKNFMYYLCRNGWQQIAQHFTSYILSTLIMLDI